MSDAIKVTVTDPDSGEILGEHILDNDYLLICAGNRYLAYEQQYPGKGVVLTVKIAR
jgi:hypothetical protein